MQIILGRHGQTLHNVQNLCSGQNDIELTDHGIWQAHALGDAMKKLGVTKLFCSDLRRALQTASIVAEYVECIPIPRQELRERSFGRFEGEKGDLLRADLSLKGEDPELYRPEGGENFSDILDRVAPFLNYLKAYVTDNVVGIIAHGNLNSALLGHWQKMNPCEVKQDSACLNIIEEPFSVEPRCILVNSVEHLARNPTKTPASPTPFST